MKKDKKDKPVKEVKDQIEKLRGYKEPLLRGGEGNSFVQPRKKPRNG